jgi:hypothetical protein
VATLILVVVLVVLALLVQPTATDRKFRLPGFTMPWRLCGPSLSACEVTSELPLIREIRLSFQHAKLLFVRFAALQRRARAARAIFRRRFPAVIYFRLVDTTLRVGVILDVAFACAIAAPFEPPIIGLR